MMNIVTVSRNEKDNTIKGKVIRKPEIARKILAERKSNDVRIIDIKPDKTDPDHKRSVFIFEDNDVFQETFGRVLSVIKDERNTSNNSKRIEELEREIEELKKAAREKE